MSSEPGPEWVTAWPRKGGLQLSPRTVALQDAEWVSWPGTGLEGRDLGLAEISGGMFAGQHVRATGAPGGEGDWHCYDLDFEFVYVLAGSLGLETLDGKQHLLVPGSSFAHTAFLWHRDLHRSADLEVVRLTLPAVEQRFDGLTTVLPARSAAGTAAAVYRSAEQGSTLLPGDRTGRDLDTADLTGGRIRLQIVDVRDGSQGGGHLPTSQWFYVLSGTAYPSSDAALAPLRAGDSLSIDAREGASRAERYELSPDFAVLALSTGAGDTP